MAKLIDEKGMLFGKINIIDFLALLFLFCIMPMFYFGYKIINKTPKPVVTVEKKFMDLIVSCQLVQLDPEIANMISVGDKQFGDNGEVIAEILEVGKTLPYKHELDFGGGYKIVKDDPYFKQINAKARLNTEVRGSDLYFDNSQDPLKMGLPFKFKTDKYSASFILTIVTEEKEQKSSSENIKLKIKFTQVPLEIAGEIKAGDTQKEVTKTTDGYYIENIIARISNIISDEPSEVMVLSENKGWRIEGHPKKRDIIVEVEARCVRGSEGLILGSQPILIGKDFVLKTERYYVSGQLIGME